MTAFLEAFTGEFLQVSGDPERNSVVIAILMLLGSRQTDMYPSENMKALESSILNFGVGDLHRLRNTRQIDSYCDDLAQRILIFDKRVAAASVRTARDDEMTGDTLKLLITVRLAGQDNPIGFATDIRLTDGNCDIRETGSE
ncbi:hypothetical protein [Parendozoicomonas sp. Alg238-R29]|uniref:GPW/gp25 family protein n=1 Tax=Parendozoicomonas sp. Alg238-R29 TaxID=2993446 RepID=UPI00248DFA95|nr:hypothetical protein [Parendozoicomonas sp. Alg238-R29]